ncbi:DUF92 domain-containing protein [Alloiococcus sp. CFN-8]|uniref:DUF92 domain-containing protein n=1 Tax=Alloiococcus sp. CFN-8 TaxID=3416081 RepID=UPI003CEFB6AD
MKELIIGLIFSSIIAVAAFKKKSLSLSGAIAAVLLGTLMYYFGGLVASGMMVAFFLSSSLLSHLFKGKKNALEKVNEKGTRRDCFQVFANGGMGLIFAALFYYFNNPLFLVGCAAAFGEANADTWASEIGVLSRKKPISIITRRTIDTGVSGGVSPLGTLASFLGAAFIGVSFSCIYFITYGYNIIIIFAPLIITFLGFIGAIIDSLLGATLQAQYYCEEEKLITEKSFYKDRANRLVKGYRIFNNDAVNFLSTLLCSLPIFLFIGR